MFGIALLSIEGRSRELSGNSWSAPPLAAEEREVLRLHFFTAAFALNPLAPSTLTDSTIEGVPGFRRCLLITEQSFERLRVDVPEALGCDFDHARWELEHPYDPPDGDPTQSLTWPASVGASIAKRLAAKHYGHIADLLNAAEYLPAKDRWESRQSESMEKH